jgi:hypothetical protein
VDFTVPPATIAHLVHELDIHCLSSMLNQATSLQSTNQNKTKTNRQAESPQMPQSETIQSHIFVYTVGYYKKKNDKKMSS